MIVKCIGSSGDMLSSKTKQVFGNSDETTYPIKINDEFVVYAQSIYRDVLSYLLIGTYEDLPSWYQAELFEVIDSQLPLEWYYKFNGYTCNVSSIWGYKELVEDNSHHDNLIERDNEAITIFLKRKKEIDEYSDIF